MEKPQDPPPQTSGRDGFETPKDHRRAYRRGKRKNESAAGDKAPDQEGEAHQGAQRIHPQREEEDQSKPHTDVHGVDAASNTDARKSKRRSYSPWAIASFMYTGTSTSPEEQKRPP